MREHADIATLDITQNRAAYLHRRVGGRLAQSRCRHNKLLTSFAAQDDAGAVHVYPAEDSLQNPGEQFVDTQAAAERLQRLMEKIKIAAATGLNFQSQLRR